ncbi:hypothetical protein L3Y34_005379 [Caenorhabditis briggsae]|uniref:Uncharacterized protein n=1 Tax=Caenorhabditis briggsae TaxID=6238 RepID=A0AAE9AEB2_CAEBR|nr:hypothetical protein L3Y34_005379 [Caenorhabditis briggsae]
MADTDEFSATGGEDRGNVSKRQLSVSKRKAISHYQAVRTSQTHLQNNGSVPKQVLHHRNQVLEKFGPISVSTSHLHPNREPI